jgi:hypothetical protein
LVSASAAGCRTAGISILSTRFGQSWSVALLQLVSIIVFILFGFKLNLIYIVVILCLQLAIENQAALLFSVHPSHGIGIG